MPGNKQPTTVKYIDPLVDFGFKKIFGSEPNKDLLIDFLNQVFRGRKHIADLTYGKTDYPGDSTSIGGAIFDLTCTGDKGEEFIIEVQRGNQQYFKERALFYTSRLISGQAPKGKRNKWAYNLKEVYLVALLEDVIISNGTGGNYLHDIALCHRTTGEIFYDKLGFTYIELRNFVKTEKQLDTDLDKWLYVLKHLSSMKKLPAYLCKPIFKKLFSMAEYSKMPKEEQMKYDTILKRKWDNENMAAYALKQAEQKKATTIASNLKKMGIPVAAIAKATGLSVEEVEKV